MFVVCCVVCFIVGVEVYWKLCECVLIVRVRWFICLVMMVIVLLVFWIWLWISSVGVVCVSLWCCVYILGV